MSDILHETESLCPVCLKRIPARYERIDGKAYMIKECPEHGEFKVLFWRDADMYESWMRQGVHAPARDHGRPEKRGCPFDCGLCDEHRSGTCTSILEITCYALGTAWYVAVYARAGEVKSVSAVLAACVVPFIPADAAKIFLAATLSRRLAPLCAPEQRRR